MVDDHVRRQLGIRALVFVSLGAVIGSGWLVVGLDAARPAGGSSVVAWLVAGALVATLALVHAELGTTFPVDGGTARFPLYAFGRVMGFLSGWFAWVAGVCIAPIETSAALRYVGTLWPGLITVSHESVTLSLAGQLVAAVVLLAFTVLNTYGLKGFSETNTVVVWAKLAVPLGVVAILAIRSFHPSNFVAGGFFSGGVGGLVAALSTGGAVFSLIGFEQAVELGGESQEPQRAVPWAVIGSLALGTFLYLVLQVAFVASMPPHLLVDGWEHVHLSGISGPYAGLAKALGAGAVASLVYVAAVVSPAGTGLTFTATASRLPYALAREGYLPKALGRVNRRDVPAVGLALGYLAGLVVLGAFPNWDDLLRFVTAAVVLVYTTAPVSLAVLRRTAPELERPYRLPAASVLGRAAFCVANLLLLWCGWDTVSVLLSVAALGVVGLAGLAGLRRRFRHRGFEWLAAAWVLPWGATVAAISVAAPYGHGLGLLGAEWASFVSVVTSLGLYELALSLGTCAHERLPAGERAVERWRKTAALAEGASR